MPPPEPRVDRPEIPGEYGLSRATEYVTWDHVANRLADARAYWLGTVGPTGRPSVRPVDGVFVDGTLFIGGSQETAWVQHVQAHPDVSIHLDGLDDVVIIDGRAEALESVESGVAERLAAASNAKYQQYGMTPAFYRKNGAIAVHIRKVVAWTDISRDPTRFRFDP